MERYKIKLLLEYLSENVLSKPDLLPRIYVFDYGYLERKNCPTRINMDSRGNNMGLNSIQTLCLVRNVSLIFLVTLCQKEIRTGTTDFAAAFTADNQHHIFSISYSSHDCTFKAFNN